MSRVEHLSDGVTLYLGDCLEIAFGKVDAIVSDPPYGQSQNTNVMGAGGLRAGRLLWDGVCVGSAARDEVTAGQQRVHPTQKPVVLMRWCIEQMALPPHQKILDPFMGAGSTGIAAIKLGHQFIGCEIEPIYFETACRRISEALKQPDMFIEKPKPAKQETLGL
jgi:site-specific DNA-methyltransferase (adenine-specific)